MKVFFFRTNIDQHNLTLKLYIFYVTIKGMWPETSPLKIFWQFFNLEIEKYELFKEGAAGRISSKEIDGETKSKEKFKTCF